MGVLRSKDVLAGDVLPDALARFFKLAYEMVRPARAAEIASGVQCEQQVIRKVEPAETGDGLQSSRPMSIAPKEYRGTTQLT